MAYVLEWQAPTVASFAQSHLASLGDAVRPFSIGQTRPFQRMQQELGLGGAYAESTLAALFWQIYTLSEDFATYLERNMAPQGRYHSDWNAGVETIVVAYSTEEGSRHDLMILHPTPMFEEVAPQTAEAVLRRADLDFAQQRWARNRLDQFTGLDKESTVNRGTLDAYRQMVEIMDRSALDEIRQSVPFAMLIATKPKTLRMRIARPCWGVGAARTMSLEPKPCATAGAFEYDNRGRFGVTAALHAVAPEGEWRQILGREAAVRGNRRHGESKIPESWYERLVGNRVAVEDSSGNQHWGRIRTLDPITDSCFIELEDMDPDRLPQSRESRILKLPSYQSCEPLVGKCPTHLMDVEFEGMASGSKLAKVIGFNRELPFITPYTQLRVYTNPVTSPGDSGAALVDRDDSKILGFCFARSGYGEAMEYSSWIWAHSVYGALDLRIGKQA